MFYISIIVFFTFFTFFYSVKFSVLQVGFLVLVYHADKITAHILARERFVV